MKPPLNPKDLGFMMPAEWELHKSTWLSWPKDPETFPPEIIDSVEHIYSQMVKSLQEGEEVKILVNNQDVAAEINNLLLSYGAGTKNVSFLSIKSVDVWTRDYAPIFVKNPKGQIATTKWIFNAWGNKYEQLKNDNEAGMGILKQVGLPYFETNIVLEGGSIDTNGKGVFLTTEQCLLNKNRNPSLTKDQIEAYLENFLGAEKIIWLKEGIAGDDTDGHVDDFARFVSEDTVVCAVEEDPKDENYNPLKEAFETLKSNGLKVIPLPMPPKLELPERRLPASYANFYIGNSCVLLPVFNAPTDKKAIEVLQNCFPTRKVIPIVATDLVYGFGGIHCVTQQQPR